MNRTDIETALQAALYEHETNTEPKVLGRLTRRLLRRFIREREAGVREHLFTSAEAEIVTVALHEIANGLLGLRGELSDHISCARANRDKNNTPAAAKSAQK